MIEFDNVSKVYPTANGPVRALWEVGFRVEQGEFVAVRGASGSGKSTLLMIAGGLCRPSSGRVVVAGVDLIKAPASALTRLRAERVGFVFQMFHLLPYLTVLENVVAASLRSRKAEARRRAGELLEQFRLGHRVHHRPAELSTGERQRVAVARALINSPWLILADEPTGNLDPDSTDGVMDLLAGFHREGGTVLLVTHEERAAAHAQRTLVLSEGTLETQPPLAAPGTVG
jgi:putative ABC transport system ATP-binding protein